MPLAIAPPKQDLIPLAPQLPWNSPNSTPQSYIAPTLVAEEQPAPDVSVGGRFEQAVKTNDAAPLIQLSEENKGTDVGLHAAETAKTIVKNTAQFNEMTKNANPTTEQGRLALVSSFQKVSDKEQAKRLGWQSVEDNPDWGKALMYFAAGDKKTAMDFVIGGQYKPIIEYNDQGKPLVKMMNSVGNFYVRDPISNRVISEKEYYEGGGSRPLEDTMARKKQIQEQESYVTKNIAATERNDDTAARFTALAPLIAEKNSIWEELYNKGEYTKEQFDRISSMSTGNITSARSMTNNFQSLEDAVKGETLDLNAGNEKSLKAALGALGEASGIPGFTIGADGKVTDGAKKSYSNKELRQLMQTNGIGAQLDRSFGQTKDDLKAQLLAGNIGLATYNKLLSAIDIDKQIEQARADIVKRHGALPSFMLPSLASSVGDAAVRPQIQAVQEMFNAVMVNKYQDWSRNEIARNKLIDSNYVPKPGELEAAFTRTREYQSAAMDAAQQAKNIRNRPYKEAPKPVETINIGGVGAAESAAIPKAIVPPAGPIETSRKETADTERQKRLDEANQKFFGSK
jgi:hypothetical protein